MGTPEGALRSRRCPCPDVGTLVHLGHLRRSCDALEYRRSASPDVGTVLTFDNFYQAGLPSGGQKSKSKHADGGRDVTDPTRRGKNHGEACFFRNRTSSSRHVKKADRIR
jgi:hypothetical protein